VATGFHRGPEIVGLALPLCSRDLVFLAVVRVRGVVFEVRCLALVIFAGGATLLDLADGGTLLDLAGGTTSRLAVLDRDGSAFFGVADLVLRAFAGGVAFFAVDFLGFAGAGFTASPSPSEAEFGSLSSASPCGEASSDSHSICAPSCTW
jgi:hypothetical protein